jgi:hypothetical protein
MAIGTGPLECFEGETVNWRWTLVDANVTSIAGWNIELVIKVNSAALDPALIGPVACTIFSASAPCIYGVSSLPIDLDPEQYVVGTRREDIQSWQLALCPLNVKDSPNKDPLP